MNVLEDVTVLDFTQVLGGPYAGSLLADHGADVISIEPPWGKSHRELLDGAIVPNVDHNKRSITLDLSTDEADVVLERLVASADIVLTNYPPAVRDRLGMDFEALQQYNERLVYCSLTGYGESGFYSDRKAYEPIAQSMSGIMSVTGEPDRKPSRVGTSVIDAASGAHMAYAVLAGLRRRDRTGEGTTVQVSLLDVATAFMGYWLTRYSRTGETPERRGDGYETGPAIGLFDTADDPVYVVAFRDEHWTRLCEAIDREEWLEDERLGSRESRSNNWAYVRETMEAAFRTFDRSELVERLSANGVPVGEYKTVPDVAADEHLRERETVVEVPNGDGSTVTIGANAVRFGGEAAEIGPPPDRGEHTTEIMAELGFSAARTTSLVDRGVVGTSSESEPG